ncbi:quinol oxidase [Streptococcus cuniculi]|uniref:Quinol oxidase n=1 Tax=Streptococcus cuniculi TaxID=1432788 RepID=A0A4Y9JCG0_9STRE|nr:quinol oxidase [Streptococcus cuniculi]MBF0778260.1 quinol oxidase [Streptococcus cuniculi]TFU97756.1 quinol oxidase [Streptococcus cuniculi]
MTETEVTYSRSESYSRRSRRVRKSRQPLFNEEFQRQMPKTKMMPSLSWSLVLSLLSVANPLLTSFATNMQSQDLYAGFAMHAGQSPYGQFFGTSGVLYYLLVYVGSSFGTTLGLVFLHWLVLSAAGIYFYKICSYFSQSGRVSSRLQTWFYLFILALSVGGVQASLFALPFVLAGLWFLLRYFERATRDEGFILYGVYGAIAFLIYSKSILLWVVSTLVLTIYNTNQRQFARGVYQALATIFGFLLIVYSVGYYTFVEQVLGAAIQQTFFYEFALNISYSGILWTLAQIFLFLLLSGFLKNLLQLLVSMGQGKWVYFKVLVVMAFAVQLLFLIADGHFELSHLVIILPYGFIMGLIELSSSVSNEELLAKKMAHYSYLQSHIYLPLLAVLLLLIVKPVVTYVMTNDVMQERQEVSRYIKESSESSDTIYAWDDSAHIYLQSERLSAGEILTATPYLDSKANQDGLTFDLNKNKARYIVVNTQVDLLNRVKSNIESNYEKVDLGTSQLTLYEKKE